MHKVAVVSCILGRAFDSVYPAPVVGQSYFFTNREDIKGEVEDKGWHFVFLDMPLSDDDATSSLQAKYVKFLQFLSADECEWKDRFDEIVYVDHKFFLKEEHLCFIKNNKSRDVLLRTTPGLKTTVWDEVNVAMCQERYRRFMPQTKAYIEEKLSEGYSESIRISNTGLIAYNHKSPQVIALVDDMYSALTKIGTAECQIVWALVSQQYSELIQQIEWDDMSILRGPPA